MNNKLKIVLLRIVFIVAPLAAVIVLGASFYLWYKALVPEAKKVPVCKLSRVSPDAFSAGLEGNVMAALEEYGIGEKDIKSRNADPVQDEINRIYTIKIPENSSLTLYNLRLTNIAKK